MLTATVGWRWVFWINLPMIATVAWAGARWRCAAGRARRRPAGQPLNLVGPVLLGAIVAVLLAATRHWLPPRAPGCRWRGAGRGFFVWYERRTPAPVFTHTANSIAANVAAFGGGRRVPRRRDVPAAAAPGRVRHGIDLPGCASACAWSGGLLLCTLGWTAGSMGAARVESRPRNQILLGTAMTFAATLVMAIPAGGAAVP